MTYLALLRGINVGGNSLVKMAELKSFLEAAGLEKVRTYIQSGNIIFNSPENDPRKMARLVEKVIVDHFGVAAGAAIFTKEQWRGIIKNAPKNWGQDPAWKHNLFALLDPADLEAVVEAAGALKPDIESLVPGDGVLYQSMLFQKFGQTTTSKLPGKPAYKLITIRNYNTATKLLGLLEEA